MENRLPLGQCGLGNSINYIIYAYYSRQSCTCARGAKTRAPFIRGTSISPFDPIQLGSHQGNCAMWIRIGLRAEAAQGPKGIGLPQSGIEPPTRLDLHTLSLDYKRRLNCTLLYTVQWEGTLALFFPVQTCSLLSCGH